MILKIFGVLDIVSAILILAHSIVPRSVMVYAATYLVVKGLIFVFMDDPLSISNWLNYADLFTAGYVVVLSFGISWLPISLLAAFFLIQKGILSFV